MTFNIYGRVQKELNLLHLKFRTDSSLKFSNLRLGGGGISTSNHLISKSVDDKMADLLDGRWLTTFDHRC